MKKFYALLCTVLFTVAIFAQAPQKLTYQALIRNSSHALVTSTPIGMQISILKGSESGSPVYVETQTPTTNGNGLVTIEIGGGTVVSGSFATIDWADGPYFIKTEVATAAPLTTYTITGVSQILSVPYALHSKTAESYTETDPVYMAWDKSSGISITSSQVTDFESSVTGNAAVTANTAKVSNAAHTGDATGSTALTVTGINGTSMAGLATGILKNTSGTGVPTIAVAGTDYLAPTGSAAALTNFPTFNQNTTGSAASFTGSLAGEVTGTQGATVVGNGAVLGKVLTGYTSGAGTIVAGDNILQAIQKLNGNDAINANLTGEVTSVGNATTIANKVTMTGTSPISVSGSPSVIASSAVSISVAPATTGTAGSMSAADKAKLDDMAPSTHYLGENLNGGVIFNIYKGSDKAEHGLIVYPLEVYTTAWQTVPNLDGASSTWDGAYNTGKMTNSNARVYVQGLGDGNWYLPAIDELELLFNNRFYANKGLAAIGGTLLGFGDYWSSTEFDAANATSLFFKEGHAYTGDKTSTTGVIRAIRSF
jgi:hypothetical protein